MQKQEARKIIAEYMGYRDAFNPCCGKNDIEIEKYSSLDALIPVWEKIRKGFNINLINSVDKYYCSVNNGEYYKDDFAETIQEAAAIATAKAIREICS